MISTTPDYWDCECTYTYIHMKKDPVCNICHATSNESPDSHVKEITHKQKDL